MSFAITRVSVVSPPEPCGGQGKEAEQGDERARQYDGRARAVPVHGSGVYRNERPVNPVRVGLAAPRRY